MAGSAPSRPLPSLNYLLGQLQTSYHYLSIKTFILYCLAFKIPTPKHNLATATNISSPLPTVWTMNYSLPHRGFDLTSHHKQPPPSCFKTQPPNPCPDSTSSMKLSLTTGNLGNPTSFLLSRDLPLYFSHSVYHLLLSTASCCVV